jgi:hypothetical protein
MGSGRWDATDWSTYSATTRSKGLHEIYTSKAAAPELKPANITVRESCDSAANPKSTPIVIMSDVTGSMGILAEQIAKHALGKVMEEIYTRKPVSDPHILLGCIGDAYVDQAPLQVTQFEAEVAKLTPQMEKFWIEGGGGGNRGESYNLAAYFCAYQTRCDAIIKRGEKGFLFTIGDEPPLPVLEAEHIKAVFGSDTIVSENIRTSDLLGILDQHWHYHHIRVKDYPNAHKEWVALLGQRVIPLKDIDKLGEVIVATLQVLAGEDPRPWRHRGPATPRWSSATPSAGSPDTESGGDGVVRL